MSSTFYVYKCSFKGMNLKVTQTDSDPPKYWSINVVNRHGHTERFRNKGLERHVRHLLTQEKLELTPEGSWSNSGGFYPQEEYREFA